MRYISIFLLCFFSFQVHSQVKGAVHQAKAPSHINEERKVENNSATALAKSKAVKLKKGLKLTEKQYDDLYKALLEYETGVEKVNAGKLSKKDQYNKQLMLNMVKQDKMKALLTKEQYNAYILSFP